MELDAFLHKLGIMAQCHEHAPVMTVEESTRLVPGLPGAKTKNLFLRDKKGLRHFLVTVRHDRTVDIQVLGAVLDAGRLGFASPDRLQRNLGVAPGAVSPLALCNDPHGAVEFVIDEALWTAPLIQAHPLVNTATMILTHRDLECFLAATGHAPTVIAVPDFSAKGPSLLAGPSP